MGRFQIAKIKRVCIDCGISYTATSPAQLRCGSKKLKTGCSYKKKLERNIPYQKKWRAKRLPIEREKRERAELKRLLEKYPTHYKHITV